MGKYTELLANRSSLPRREILENRILSCKRSIQTITDNMAELLNKHRETIYQSELQLRSYSFSYDTLSFLAQAEQLPEQQGVYVIFVNDQPVYVGESVNLQKRAIDHSLSILGNFKNNSELYDFLRLQPVKSILIKAHTIDTIDKSHRLDIEGELCNKYIADGYSLFNKRWKGKPIAEKLFSNTVANEKEEFETEFDIDLSGPTGRYSADGEFFTTSQKIKKKIITSQSEWDELLDSMSRAVRRDNFIPMFL